MVCPMNASAFDQSHFDHMTGGDRALQAEIVDLFRGQAAVWRAGLAHTDGNWRDAAHMLKGSARGIGLMALAQACETAERLGDESAAASLAAVRAELEAALEALEVYSADTLSL